MLLTKIVKVKIINFNQEIYQNKGYNCKIGDVINVKTEDVSNYSKTKVMLLCDKCKRNKKEITITSLCNSEEYKDGNYICSECKKTELKKRKCEICGSTHNVSNYLNQGILLCGRHKNQIRKYGYIKRNSKDRNEIRIFEDYLEFDTYDKNSKVNGTFKADLDMKNFIETHKMHKHKDGYACYKFRDENGKIKNMRFHRYVLNIHLEKENKIIVDHINRDKSDNRKINLRKADFKTNNINTGMFITNTSGHKGVSWDKRSCKWESYIHKNNKKISLGLYIDIEKAVKAREIAEIIYFGKKNPNFNNLINKYINDSKVKSYLKSN